MKYEPVLDLITPSEEEIRRVKQTREDFSERIERTFLDIPNYFSTVIIGSSATENFLRGYRDLDALILFNKFNKEKFREKLQQIHEIDSISFRDDNSIVLDKINGRYNYFNISVGAILNGQKPEENLAIDMSRHPEFTRIHIDKEKRKEVLLTKQFFKNLRLYGSKMGGFPIEQLIAKYGSFENVLEVLKGNERIFVDFSGKYSGTPSPMIVSYPYCGLDNLAKRITSQELDSARDYAKIVSENPEKFLEDSRRIINMEFWNKRVKKYGKAEEFSIPDVYLNHKENRILRKKLNPNSNFKILDLGCANGHSTFAINRPGNNLVWGIDSNEDAIKMAKELMKKKNLKGIEFLVGEIANPKFDEDYFDAVYAKRSLSNLPSQREQEKAVKKVATLLKRGGKFYIFDLFEEGYSKLNEIRSRKGLEKINLPFHCLPLTDKLVKDMANENFAVMKEEDPTSTYYLMSRVFMPSILKYSGKEPNPKSAESWIFSWMPSLGKLGVNKLYILEKK